MTWLFVGYLFFFSVDVAANTPNSDTPFIDPKHNAWINLTENVAYKPNSPSEERLVRKPLGGNSFRARIQISEEALRQYLASKGSPLSPYAARLLASPYYSVIVGICTIEQYSCSRLPGGTNWNLWGIMKSGGGLQFYGTAEEGIQAIHNYLERAETVRGRPTIESFRGWYCLNRNYAGNICPNWEPTVLRIKAEVESL